jgi:DNA polymerase-3 subunit gamma/tau
MEGSSSSYMVIARRYRPQRFDQVLGQDAVVATLKNAIQQGRVAQAYLFCGTRGTGKTTLARLVAKALNCPKRGNHPDPCGQCQTCKEISAGISLDVLEIDGASNRGIDDIRTLTESAPYAAAGGGVKVTIIDEVHMLTKEAFNALLKTLEEPPPNLKFIFATTEPHKVPATILSRCQRFDLARIPTDVLMKKLTLIAEEMGRAVSEEALYLIASQAEGSFRDSESLLDQVLAYQPAGEVLPQTASVALGLAPRQLWFHLDQAVQEQSLEDALEIAQSIIQSGIDVTQALEQLLEHLRCHLLCQLGRLPVAMPVEWVNLYQSATEAYQRDQLLLLLDELSLLWQQARQQTPSIWTLEYALLAVVRSRGRLSVESLVRRLLEAEARLAQSSSAGSSAAPVASAKAQPPPQRVTPSSEADRAANPLPKAAPALNATQRVDPVPPALASASAGSKGRKAGEGPQNHVPLTPAAAPRTASQTTLFVATEPARPVVAAAGEPRPSMADRTPKPAAPEPSAERQAGSPAEGTALPPGRADTLMRFAAVELEGILSPPSNR